MYTGVRRSHRPRSIHSGAARSKASVAGLFFFFAKTSDAGLFYFYFESPLYSQFYTVKNKSVAGLYFCLKVLYIASFM